MFWKVLIVCVQEGCSCLCSARLLLFVFWNIVIVCVSEGFNCLCSGRLLLLLFRKVIPSSVTADWDAEKGHLRFVRQKLGLQIFLHRIRAKVLQSSSALHF